MVVSSGSQRAWLRRVTTSITFGVVAAGAVLHSVGASVATPVSATTPVSGGGTLLIDCFAMGPTMTAGNTTPGFAHPYALLSMTYTGEQPDTVYYPRIEDGPTQLIGAPQRSDAHGTVTFTHVFFDRAQPGRPYLSFVAGTTRTAFTDTDPGGSADLDPYPTSVVVHDNPSCGTLKDGGYQHQILSADHRYRLVQQADGNLVLYLGSHAQWQSGTSGRPGATTVLQHDGNLVVYSASHHALWSSRTAGHPGAVMTVRNDGRVVVSLGARVLWSGS